MTLRPSPGAGEPTDRIRALCLGLADVTERQSHGEAAWFVRKKSFATMADRHHDDRIALWIAADEGVQTDLVARHPDRYFRPPYVGSRGWIGAYLDERDVPCDWDEIAELLSDGWKVAAPGRSTRAR